LAGKLSLGIVSTT